MSFKNLLGFSVLVMCLLFCSSCTWMNKLTSIKPGGGVCAEPESEGSVICDWAESKGTTPEAISKTLLFTNFAVLETGIAPADKSVKYIKDVIKRVESYRDLSNELGREITLGMAVDYISKKYKALPTRVQGAFTVLSPSQLTGLSVSNPMVDKDFEMILYQLYEMLKLAEIYLE